MTIRIYIFSLCFFVLFLLIVYSVLCIEFKLQSLASGNNLFWFSHVRLVADLVGTRVNVTGLTGI